LLKTTKKLENSKTANRFLEDIKRAGRLSAAELSDKHGISVEGARQQLTKLMEKGWVVPEPEMKGVGRPALRYKLTEQGHDLFPDMYKELSVQILNSVDKVLGKEALDAVILARADEVESRYRAAVDEVHTIEEKLDVIRKMRCEEGYMAEWRLEDDIFVFVENHCPIGAAAHYCTGFCKAELKTMQRLLGSDYEVEREEHLPNGDRRCMYKIRVKMLV
jgi:predicted ArsR family transcriptional regulator